MLATWMTQLPICDHLPWRHLYSPPEATLLLCKSFLCYLHPKLLLHYVWPGWHACLSKSISRGDPWHLSILHPKSLEDGYFVTKLPSIWMMLPGWPACLSKSISRPWRPPWHLYSPSKATRRWLFCDQFACLWPGCLSAYVVLSSSKTSPKLCLTWMTRLPI